MNRHLFSSASFVLCLMSGGLFASAACAANLAPHRAYYDLTTKRLASGKNISSITGKLAYEIRGSACDGYAVSYRIANRILYVEGSAQVIDTHMTSWESGDGLELDLRQKQFVDAKLNSENRIKVKKDAANAPGKGQITTTGTKTFETAATAVFPTQYQLKLIDAALKGEPRDSSIVFEGSDDDKSMKAITFMGGRRQVAGLPEQQAKELAGLGAWPVSISYYAVDGKGDDQPNYQASFLMLENGISTNLELDYGDYVLAGRLSKLEMLKAEPCN